MHWYNSRVRDRSVCFRFKSRLIFYILQKYHQTSIWMLSVDMRWFDTHYYSRWKPITRKMCKLVDKMRNFAWITIFLNRFLCVEDLNRLSFEQSVIQPESSVSQAGIQLEILKIIRLKNKTHPQRQNSLKLGGCSWIMMANIVQQVCCEQWSSIAMHV